MIETIIILLGITLLLIHCILFIESSGGRIGGCRLSSRWKIKASQSELDEFKSLHKDWSTCVFGLNTIVYSPEVGKKAKVWHYYYFYVRPHEVGSYQYYKVRRLKGLVYASLKFIYDFEMYIKD